jgi:hypothetical protein
MKRASRISKVVLAVFFTVPVVVAVIATVVLAQSPDELDEVGNYGDSGRQHAAPGQPSPQHIGDVLNSFPNPSTLRGLTFREGRLWGVTSGDGSGVLYEMDADSGTVLSTITISPLPDRTFGLGFDTLRNVFVVTGGSAILKVDPMTGTVIGSLPAPGSVSVGAAYDSTRDGYWIADSITNKLHLVNPDTGVEITSLSVPAGASRIAGTGYDPINDVIMFHSRDSAETYLIKASDGVQVGVFPTPPSPGTNNGQGAAIRPTDLTGHLTRFGVATIFVVDLDLPSSPPPDWQVFLPLIFRNYDSLVLYFDDFSDPTSGWFTGDNNDTRWSYQDGEYEMLIRNANWWAGATAPIGGLTSYSIEADMRGYSSSTNVHGLIFGLVDWDHFYIFAIYPNDQNYAVLRCSPLDYVYIVDWTYSPYINSSNASNRLKVERNGGQIVVYANDHLLTTVNDGTYTGSLNVGLFARAGDNVPFAVRYDNFRVRQLRTSTVVPREVSAWHKVEMSADGGSILVPER